jgi:hypothetical protein
MEMAPSPMAYPRIRGVGTLGFERLEKGLSRIVNQKVGVYLRRVIGNKRALEEKE